MVDQVTYRTTDPSRWGTGQGSDLTASQIDINFWVLQSAILAIQDHEATWAGIDYITVSGQSMIIHLTNHVALGPFTLPMAQWAFRGPWAANANYQINDVITFAGALYLVTWPIPDAGSFFGPFQNDGLGHNWYATILEAAPNELPTTGNPKSFLRMTLLDSPKSAAWVNLTRQYAMYLETTPDPLEEILRYVFTETITFPVGLTASKGNCGTAATVLQQYQVFLNGASVGHINWNGGSFTANFDFAVQKIAQPGDVLTILAPSVPDPHHTMIAFTLVGTQS